MDIKSQAQLIFHFLDRYKIMWDDEIMNTYPESINHYPKEWIQLLDSLSSDELYAIDCKNIPAKIKGSSLEQFIEEVKKISHLPFALKDNEIPLEQWAFNGVKEKKRHEIQSIIPKLIKVKNEKHFDCVVDIGGGVGHLSRILAHYHATPSISIDRDSCFQKIGKERLNKYRKLPNSCEVQFINMTFGEQKSEEQLKDFFRPKSFALGLHTCGPLANVLIQKTIDFKTSGLLNFGCCYYRLNPDTDFPLSNYYKENHFLKLNLYALSLATRSHAEMTRENHDTKKQVKYYRYALHLFLMKHFNHTFFNDVGECNVKMYWEPFSHYIRNKLSELKLNHQFSDSDFNQFYNDFKTQEELKIMWLCNIVRWQLGRALEVYLLLDRHLYLEEKGFEVKIEQYFKEALSPRNIGILAVLKN